MADDRREARKEIYETLRLCNFCIGSMGISLIDDISKNLRGRLKTYFALFMTFTLILGIISGQYTYIAMSMITSDDAIEGLIGSNLHTAGYGLMSLAKVVTLWYKRNKLRQLVGQLADIWPISVKSMEEANIKRESLSILRNRQIMYTLWNVLGFSFFGLTPIALFIYHKARGQQSQFGYIFLLTYPFDKTEPINHVIAYAFEACSGSLAVFSMLGNDLLFMTMASHITMLLRLLQVRIINIINNHDDIQRNTGTIDCYENIADVVKIHQQVIHYLNDLEGAFSIANLINVLISSVNICCCAFNIVFLDPWMHMSNKFFLGAALTQMGIICWYADDIFRASVGVSDSVYKSAWYRCDVRCRRALLLMLQRSQKPLYFTALKFSPITMATYSSFLDPWMHMSNKFFLGAALTQMGIICWYADDIFRASVGVSDSVYKSAWYRCDVRCRRALLLMLQRSQKPLYFTALKFSPITMATYSSVLTNSYSYFTLLYTSYKRI